MRRSAKPFTVEVKRGGSRKKRNGAVPHGGDNGFQVRQDEAVPGWDLRFREAENAFRDLALAPEPELPLPVAPPREVEAEAPDAQPAAKGRILVDLVAEAALAERAAEDVAPAPRRRGRPPKDRAADGETRQSARRGRPPKQWTWAADAEPEPDLFEVDSAPLAPVLLDLAASARRRAARSTDHLPRGERWKRRLPRVCW